jgi:hypothetical protein
MFLGVLKNCTGNASGVLTLRFLISSNAANFASSCLLIDDDFEIRIYTCINIATWPVRYARLSLVSKILLHTQILSPQIRYRTYRSPHSNATDTILSLPSILATYTTNL